ncbi:MAG: four helix bundle protein [Bacteroidota bacterium]
MNKSILKEKSYSFALRIVKLYKFLSETNREFVLSKQILRSGTSIGALIREAEFAQSKPDFINKMSIALKEANETLYWINIFKDSGFIKKKMFDSISNDCDELIRLLVATIKTSKTNLIKK